MSKVPTAHDSGQNLLHRTICCRDDILSWAARRSGARCIAALNASLKTSQLETCVAWNTATCMNRVGTMAPARDGHPQQGTRALVAEAVAPANLCRMCPTCFAWL